MTTTTATNVQIRMAQPLKQPAERAAANHGLSLASWLRMLVITELNKEISK